MIRRCINVIKKNKGSATSGSSDNASLDERVDIRYDNANGDSLFKDINIRPGLQLTISNSQCPQGSRTVHEIERAPISLGYNIRHPIRCTITHGRKKGEIFERSPGNSVLSYLPETSCIIETPPCEQILGISIHFSVDTFRGLFNEVPECLAKLIDKPRASHPRQHHFYQQSPFNSETFLILQQIMACPYHGEIRRLFIEAKIMELVALKMVEMGDVRQPEPPNWTHRDTERIKEAYQILLDKIAHPPSLGDLGRQVGINRNKLNHGFKQIYGDTVFNVLRNIRLYNAWELLLNSETSLVEIALMVGYNNQANFTNAFRRHFGKTPNAVRQESLCLCRTHKTMCLSQKTSPHFEPYTSP